MSDASHPAWGAWIEIRRDDKPAGLRMSHPAWGAWIEIGYSGAGIAAKARRTPHGVRGLKFANLNGETDAYSVAPRMGCVD